MLLIGLTGSIATGKSTVASLLSSPPYSLPVIDADLVARQVVEPGSRGYHAILQRFGSSTPNLLVDASDTMPILGPDGKGRPLNRPVLGRRVFGSDPERQRDRAALNRIIHPAVRRRLLRLILSYYLRCHWAVVLDIPLLFETGLDRYCGFVLVVGLADSDEQLRRLIARDPHLSPQDAESRIRSQADIRLKAALCLARGPRRGAVLWNDGSRELLARQLADIISALRRRNPICWSRLLWACPPLALMMAVWIVMANEVARRCHRPPQPERRRRDVGGNAP